MAFSFVAGVAFKRQSRGSEALSPLHLAIMLRAGAAQADIAGIAFAHCLGEQQMIQTDFSIRNAALFGLCAAICVGLASGSPARAQGPAAPPPADYIEALKACRAVTDEDQRLVCYDAKVGAMVAASEAGEVRVVDREDLVRTRRQLFGFTIPKLDILEGEEQDKEASELLATSISGARQLSSKTWRFTTAEGAAWEISNPPRRLDPIKAGDKVEFKKAALGTFFIRINGQLGVKGKRIE